MAALVGKTPAPLRPLVAALVQHPVAGVVGGTFLGMSGVYYFYSQRTRYILMQTVQQMKEDTAEATAACMKTLKELDANWTHDIRKKDQLIRRLHMQNIEQMRSIDRLSEALSQCDAPGLNLPSYSKTYPSFVTDKDTASETGMRPTIANGGVQANNASGSTASKPAAIPGPIAATATPITDGPAAVTDEVPKEVKEEVSN